MDLDAKTKGELQTIVKDYLQGNGGDEALSKLKSILSQKVDEVTRQERRILDTALGKKEEIPALKVVDKYAIDKRFVVYQLR